MLFTEPSFLFLFLPIVLIAYFCLNKRLRNSLLLIASLYFYAVGENYYVLLMLGSCLFNYLMALFIDRIKTKLGSKVLLTIAVTGNLLLLCIYKYSNFVVDNFNVLLSGLKLSPIEIPDIHLPIGISFFTFQAMSYVIDVYRQEVKVQKNPVNIALYISLFPQLIAGPIVRYHDIALQIEKRFVTLKKFAEGIERFTIGLGKKMILANTLALPADQIFAIPETDLTFRLAWFGIVCYSLQIYFDFSGYSDMAIGLGKMFGFEFLENFNYPYISSSISEFWRRWHISLSTWFRDYLYIPLGGNRVTPVRVYCNLITVFFLCGLWHGASFNFIIWGLFHGSFLILERQNLLDGIIKKTSVWKHIYLLVVVMIGWVFFRAETLPQAMTFLSAMAGFANGMGVEYHLGLYTNNFVILALIASVIGSTPFVPFVQKHLLKLKKNLGNRGYYNYLFTILSEGISFVCLATVFLTSVCLSAAGTYNPFIYFRF